MCEGGWDPQTDQHSGGRSCDRSACRQIGETRSQGGVGVAS